MKLPAKTQAFLIEIGELSRFTLRFFQEVFRPRYEWSELVRQCFVIGYKSLSLVGLTALIMGLVITMQDFRTLGGIREGEGTVGALLRDTAMAKELSQVVRQLNTLETELGALAQQTGVLVSDLNTVLKDVQTDLQQGQGPARLIMQDSLAAARVQNTLGNLEQAIARFNENMEALKHNFLFRRYFKKQERKARKGN